MVDRLHFKPGPLVLVILPKKKNYSFFVLLNDPDAGKRYDKNYDDYSCVWHKDL